MVLVTGATGILGRVIVLELLKNGKTVFAAKRTSSNLDEVRKSFRYYTDNAETFFNKIHWIDLDLNDPKNIDQNIKGIEDIYHCAAKVSYDPADAEIINHINTEGTKKILKAAVKAGIKRFLHVSSAAVFRNQEDSFINEISKYIDCKKATLYAISKYKAEIEVIKARAEGLNTIIINPGMIIGSGNWENSSNQLLTRFIESFYTFSGGSGCIDVRDVAKIAVLLMDRNTVCGQFILVSENKKFEEISKIIRNKINKPKALILTKKNLQIGCFLNLFLGKIFPKLRMLTQANIDFLSLYPKLSNLKIILELEYHFIPVEESILFHISNYLRQKN